MPMLLPEYCKNHSCTIIYNTFLRACESIYRATTNGSAQRVYEVTIYIHIPIIPCSNLTSLLNFKFTHLSCYFKLISLQQCLSFSALKRCCILLIAKSMAFLFSFMFQYSEFECWFHSLLAYNFGTWNKNFIPASFIICKWTFVYLPHVTMVKIKCLGHTKYSKNSSKCIPFNIKEAKEFSTCLVTIFIVFLV